MCVFGPQEEIRKPRIQAPSVTKEDHRDSTRLGAFVAFKAFFLADSYFQGTSSDSFRHEKWDFSHPIGSGMEKIPAKAMALKYYYPISKM